MADGAKDVGSEQIVARLVGVTHRYGKTLALDGIDLEIPAGGMVGFIGPDGVGKSSVLALISGARRIQTGGVFALGYDLKDSRARMTAKPRIAYMPQGLGKNLYPTLSVEENVDFFGRIFGQDKQERRQRIDELLASTGLARFRDRPAAKLSGGMKQKLSLCCSLIHDPDLLILDEPTTGVDPLSRRQFWELIDRIRARRPGMSTIVATAYMEEAERFGWLVAMDAGHVIGTGSPAELKTRTGATTLEAAFVELMPPEKRGGEKLIIPPRPPSHDIVIDAEGLTQRFGDFTAVDHVSFHIERGEIFGFLGSNGCGKTTTMKMLTGLLPPTEGKALLFGREVAAGDLMSRGQVGYMSQAFSLYRELTVMQNLVLHARLFELENSEERIAALVERFGLGPYADTKADALPLGIRQRLSLAVAVVHSPPLLILDEPTSGVDPVARDQFWALLLELSRQEGVTIFVSTHFMNEAERCDRISLMNAGKVLASDKPAALVAAKGAASLEDAFIAYLTEATAATAPVTPEPTAPAPARAAEARPGARFSLQRLLAYAYREGLELSRDRLRMTFALLGSVFLMLVLGYGITLDVEDLPFAVLDRNDTPESRDYVQNIAGSRYFSERAPLKSQEDVRREMSAGHLAVALEIPPRFGADLRGGRQPEVLAWVDGAMPYRSETAQSYVQGTHQLYLADLYERTQGKQAEVLPAKLETRYRYNQDVRSIDAMVPAVIPLLLMFIPAILAALAVVREKDLGSITNFYVTPVTRLEFLLGKQLPYIAMGMISLLLLSIEALVVFHVPIKGGVLALFVAGLMYVAATTGIGLLVSTFTRTQVAALAATAIMTMLPTTQFAGLNTPVSSLEGVGGLIGRIWPATYFITTSRAIFSKALGFAELRPELFTLAIFAPVLVTAAVLLLPRQEK